MVIYIDSVFFLNACMDGLLLYFTGYLSGIERKLYRLILAGCIGGIYAISAFFEWGELLMWAPVKLLIGILLLFVAYGKAAHFIRLFAVFIGLSCAVAGVVVACSFFVGIQFYYNGAFLLPIDFRVLFGSVIFCFAVLYFFNQGSTQHQVKGEIVQGSCEILGKRIEIRTLQDNGNTLRDEFGHPVLVVEGAAIKNCWPEKIQPYLTNEYLKKPELAVEKLYCMEKELFIRILAYRTVGTSSGMLLACNAKNAVIGTYRIEKVTLALSPTPVSEQQEYHALWGGPVK